MKKEGYGTKFTLTNKTLGAYMAFDGFSHDLHYDDKVTVQIADPQHDLSYFEFN